jgi:Ca-activated chloride channel family protein
VKYQLVTDYTSMVVLADDVFEKRGIARNNKQRIEIERAAQVTRSTAGPVNRSVDHVKPMFRGRPHGLKGGGAFDVWTMLLSLISAVVLWRVKS